ncbi:uncharacterized protein FIBRA_08075 [Fibroporia radiculosa]|uniref:Arrestin-like N-terminal domain-containing protein n=1 Tax=Fibroporia radiculosa TaxID=599839 RepID=J4H4Z3_9APHY|nr:uncharacterized protein FIBRA_08075 [Fibroporia radiculosa]CCM05839.1 predicted protein [Fibroporia radiculosa]
MLLYIPQTVCVSGGIVKGTVELDFRLLHEEQVEEVHVKLRGYARTDIRRNNQTIRQFVELARENTSVWTRGSIYPSPGQHALVVPFQFRLPADLPPSFSCSTIGAWAVVRYYVEAVGVRPGMLRLNKRASQPLAVVPHDSIGQRIKTQVLAGWRGPMGDGYAEKRIRKGLWGDYATVEMKYMCPMISVFPLFTKVPFVLTIVTKSKEMDRDSEKKLWPVPPRSPREWSNHTVCSLGGLGGSAGDPDMETPENEWIPSESEKGKGRWKQTVSFSSSLEFKCPPSFRFPILTCEYSLHIEVSFGGLFNSISVDIPAVIGSGMLSLEDTTQSDTSPIIVVHPSANALDLPPSYWSTESWNDHKE